MSFSIRPSILAVVASSQAVGAQPKTGSNQEATPKDQGAGGGGSLGHGITDGVEQAVSGLNFAHIHDLLSNPILHPVPNPGPIPRS
jgi:hypothetical protein